MNGDEDGVDMHAGMEVISVVWRGWSVVAVRACV